MTSRIACPYAVLSVPREATIDEIRKSYKRLAILHHPDKNDGKVEATEMFQKISAAYAVLSDEEKRRRYDMTGSLEEEDFEGGDMDDLMQMFFGAMGGGGISFSGGGLFFETSFRVDPFMQGHSEDSDDFFGDYEDDIFEVLPALFCEHFIENVDSTSSRPTYRCTLCQMVMRSEETAESHYINNHSSLVEKFIEILETMSLEDDVEELFEEFADQVRSGQISEKKKRIPVRRKPKKKSAPKVVPSKN